MLESAITRTYVPLMGYVYLIAAFAMFKKWETPLDKLLFLAALASSAVGSILFHLDYNFIAPLEVELTILSPIMIFGSVLIVSRYISKEKKAKEPAVINDEGESLLLQGSSPANVAKYVIIFTISIALYLATLEAFNQIIRPTLKSMFVP